MTRTRRYILIASAALLVAIAVVVYKASTSPEPKLYSLAEALWVIDASGQKHPPGSVKSKEVLLWLGKGTNTFADQKYEGAVFLNERALLSTASEDEPFIIMPFR